MPWVFISCVRVPQRAKTGSRACWMPAHRRHGAAPLLPRPAGQRGDCANVEISAARRPRLRQRIWHTTTQWQTYRDDASLRIRKYRDRQSKPARCRQCVMPLRDQKASMYCCFGPNDLPICWAFRDLMNRELRTPLAHVAAAVRSWLVLRILAGPRIHALFLSDESFMMDGTDFDLPLSRGRDL